MREVQPTRIPNFIDLLTAWLPRLAIAVAFLGIGWSTFHDPMWVRIFDRIGFGQWFRFLTGVLQMAGGVLTLVPRLTLVGLSILAATMTGAVVTWIAFGQPFGAVIPGTILIALVVVAAIERNRAAAYERNRAAA